MTREEAKSRLEWICKNHKCLSLESKHCYEAIKMGAEALENQKTGHWIDDDKYGTSCSICGKWYTHPYLTKEEVIYCCRCGAKMKGE